MPGGVGSIGSAPQPIATNPPIQPQQPANIGQGVQARPAQGQQPAARLNTLPGAQAAAAQRHAAPNTGIRGAIASGVDAFKRAVGYLFSTHTVPPPTIPATVTISSRGQNVTFVREQYEQMINALPPSQRHAAVANLQATLQRRVDIGNAIIDSFHNNGGRNLPPATAQNVADFTLALYAQANLQGDTFTDGSFSIKDNDGTIARWLDTSPDLYVRSSSHLSAYQGKTVDGHLNMQRGIDIPEGTATGVPNGHRTVLYGTIPDPGTGGNGPGRRLFLKTESAGCRLNNASSSSKQAALTPGMHVRDWHLSDIGEMVRHGLSFLHTRGQQGNTTSRKEHFPSAVKSSYDTLKSGLGRLAKRHGPDSDAAKVLAQLTDGNPAKGGGVCMLQRNLDAIRRDYPHFTNAVAALQIAINTMPHHDRLDIRLGNEVILEI